MQDSASQVESIVADHFLTTLVFAQTSFVPFYFCAYLYCQPPFEKIG